MLPKHVRYRTALHPEGFAAVVHKRRDVFYMNNPPVSIGFERKFRVSARRKSNRLRVGLSNILDSEQKQEFSRGQPVQGTYREVVAAGLAGSELPAKVGEGEEAVGVIEAFLIFAVAALHLAVMARRVRADQLVADAQLGGGDLEQCR